jgi:hypothetical protein
LWSRNIECVSISIGDQWTPEAFARRMKTIREGFLKQVRHPPSLSEAQTLATRFRG